jgi:RHS repeat-associated protein
MGRVTAQYQRTDSVNYLAEATYYLDSSLHTEVYPAVPGASDRRTVTYTPDNAGRLGSWSSSSTSYAAAASVSSIGYASQNAINTETYGNSLIHAVSYNNRQQPSEIKLGTSGNSTSVLDINYTYSDSTHVNNGNVLSLSYGGGGLSYTQEFTYDTLNRLSTATEKTGSTTNWSQTNAYDRYNNRQIDLGGSSYNLAFSSTTNRITTSGYSYDSSGNLTNDGTHSYGFDAESKVAKVDGTTAYVYNGEGNRVKKLVGESTRFIYGIGGQLVAEYDSASGNLKKEYLAGGITIEPTAVNSNGVQYPTGDHLGSPRVMTNASGSVVSRHDYKPFGEELCASVGGRTTGMGFCNGGDTNRKQFTGYERDVETGLDFAQARYYASAHGRFTSPDPFSASAIIADPQTFNRYQYCRNNPVNSTDPSGLAAVNALFSMSTGDGRGMGMSSKAHGAWSENREEIEALWAKQVEIAFRAIDQSQSNNTALAQNPAGPSQPSSNQAAAASQPRGAVPPPFSSGLEGSPVYQAQNPTPAGVIITLTKPKYVDDLLMDDGNYRVGVLALASISVVDRNGTEMEGPFLIQEQNTSDTPLDENRKLTRAASIVDYIGAAAVVPRRITQAESDQQKGYMATNRITQADSQVLQIGIAGRGAILTVTSDRSVFNTRPVAVDARGIPIPNFTITFAIRSITSNVIGSP